MVQADKEKLLKLLDYWMEHNTEHGDEFKEWAERAEGWAGAAVRDDLLAAAQQMESANEFLLRALDGIRGSQG